MSISHIAKLIVISATVTSGCFAVSSSFHRSADSGSAIICTLGQVKDEESGLPAFNFLVPDGWNYKGKVALPNKSVYAFIQVATPDHSSFVNYLNMALRYRNWKNVPPSGVYLGSATDFLKFEIGTIAKNNHLTDVKINSQGNTAMPLGSVEQVFANRFKNGGGYFKEIGVLSASASKDGTPMKIFLGALVSGGNDNNYGQFKDGYYSVQNSITVLYPENCPKRLRTELTGVMSSFHMTKQFDQHLGMMVDANNRASYKEINDPNWHEKSMKRFKDQEGAKADDAHHFMNYVKDQDDYVGANGKVVTLPMFKNAWSNENGKYLLSDSPDFSPKKDYPSENWSKLTRKGV